MGQLDNPLPETGAMLVRAGASSLPGVSPVSSTGHFPGSSGPTILRPAFRALKSGEWTGREGASRGTQRHSNENTQKLLREVKSTGGNELVSVCRGPGISSNRCPGNSNSRNGLAALEGSAGEWGACIGRRTVRRECAPGQNRRRTRVGQAFPGKNIAKLQRPAIVLQ